MMGASSASVKSDFAAIGRVPVVSASGKRLMPCKPSKAKKLLEAGKAEEKRGNDGSIYLQLKFDPASPVSSSPVSSFVGGFSAVFFFVVTAGFEFRFAAVFC